MMEQTTSDKVTGRAYGLLFTGNFPLFCPKCKEESLIDAEKFIVKEARR